MPSKLQIHPKIPNPYHPRRTGFATDSSERNLAINPPRRIMCGTVPLEIKQPPVPLDQKPQFTTVKPRGDKTPNYTLRNLQCSIINLYEIFSLGGFSHFDLSDSYQETVMKKLNLKSPDDIQQLTPINRLPLISKKRQTMGNCTWKSLLMSQDYNKLPIKWIAHDYITRSYNGHLILIGIFKTTNPEKPYHIMICNRGSRLGIGKLQQTYTPEETTHERVYPIVSKRLTLQDAQGILTELKEYKIHFEDLFEEKGIFDLQTDGFIKNPEFCDMKHYDPKCELNSSKQKRNLIIDTLEQISSDEAMLYDIGLTPEQVDCVSTLRRSIVERNTYKQLKQYIKCASNQSLLVDILKIEEKGFYSDDDYGDEESSLSEDETKDI